MVQAKQQRLIDILDYWHKIEFFIPFDLDQISDIEDQWKLRWIRPETLTALPATYFQQLDIPPDRKITGFNLYLGLFDRAEIAELCEQVLPDMGNEDEDEQRGDMHGRTCFARLALTAHGEPVFDPFSISTVPWALGRVLSSGLESLTLDAFQVAQADLSDRLQDFRTQRVPATPSKPGGPRVAPLTGREMQALLELLVAWSRFLPRPGQPLLLEIKTVKKSDKGKPDDGDEDTEAPAVDILNSFYIEDLERAMRTLREGEVPMLAAYLEPLAVDQRIDVYTDAGRQALLRQLHPLRGNRGHWLSQPAFSMSLMQQFAINTSLADLGDGGLFSVNGPPGTGKTTLLRELFCENVVRRAAVLAGLRSAADAFGEKVHVHFTNGQKAWVSTLKPELTGFEMVVASSNNAAVENISRDLPKLKPIGADWKTAGYLKSVAYRIAAEDGDGIFHPSAEAEPWGLISCALGNSANRRRFVSKFYHNNWNEKVEPDERCQNIRQWLLCYAGPGFAQAATAYRAAQRAVELAVTELACFADLWQQHQGVSRSQYCRAANDVLEAARAAAQQALDDSDAAHTAVQALLERQADLREEERLLDRQAPGLLQRWFKPASARAHREDCCANAGAQRELLRQVAEARKTSASCVAQAGRLQAEAGDAEAALRQCEQEWEQRRLQLMHLRQRYACVPPASADDLEQDGFQIQGLWHDPELDSLRTRLFIAALALHEAWLAEVGKKDGGFGGNLFALSLLLTNKRPDQAAHVPLIWQSLFMAVPVVSTTFASLARQFRGMGAASIGWLFIDEAGQAVPQAAVGGLWRARRAVVVGDPRQIEPVFTVPLSLIRALSAQSPHTAGEAYAPDKVSVQRLADDANRYGTLAPEPGGPGLWIGAPLRVHRRCADPMFSLANAIAYDGKMVIEPERRGPLPLPIPMGESAWIDIAGASTFKQVVPAQIDFVVQLIVDLYRQQRALPALYVISPFKAVKNAVRQRLQDARWPGKPPTAKALKAWCKESVGTVHTFQGKEQAMVLMVLGVDAEGAGSAGWASAKANLLNVALTRAQHYFYVIGAAEVWREMDYFAAVHSRLPVLGASEFLAGVGMAPPAHGL